MRPVDTRSNFHISDTCTKYREDSETGHDLGEKMLSKYRSTYLPAIAKRLQEDNPGFEFTGSYSLIDCFGTRANPFPRL